MSSESLQMLLASVFIAFFIVFIAFWCLPDGYVMRKILHRLIDRAVIFLGLDNYWALFAPAPFSKRLMIGFEIALPGGRVVPWSIPEFGRKDGLQHIRSTRHLKWFCMILSVNNEGLMVATCRSIVREYLLRTPGAEMPESVRILRFYELPEEQDFLGIGWMSQVIYTHDLP